MKEPLVLKIDKEKLKLIKSNLMQSAADRPLITPELHESNDYYGHASVIKKYSGFPNEYVVKAAMEHGVMFTDFIWEVDLRSPLPAIITFSKARKKTYRKVSTKPIIPIGPYIAYASHYLDKQALEFEKKRLGRMLLVFPMASTHWIDFNYDIKTYCRELEIMGKDFDAIGICMYWKDILNGKVDYFLNSGYECFTAGHMFDPLFLSRLKSIIELSTVTTSNHAGTYLGYSIYMGKPFWWSDPGKVTIIKPDHIPHDETPASDPLIVGITSAFLDRNSDISSVQQDLVERYWGISAIKSRQELREILKINEKIYRKMKLKETIIKSFKKMGSFHDKIIRRLRIN